MPVGYQTVHMIHRKIGDQDAHNTWSEFLIKSVLLHISLILRLIQTLEHGDREVGAQRLHYASSDCENQPLQMVSYWLTIICY